MDKKLRIISYGGGVQSTALLVLAVTGRLADVDAVVSANVGDDSEYPATLEYIREIAAPYAASHGMPLHLLNRVKRDGQTETLYQRLTKPDSRSLPIPVRMSNGAPGTRACTADFKIRVVGKWLKANGASKDNPAEVCIGISTDEIARASNKRAMPYETPMYPLLDFGYDRAACQRIIENAGLPVPPKSACYFCPFHRPQTWAEMARDEPELFEKSAALEDLLNERRRMLGRDEVYLTRFGRPLREVIQPAQGMLPLFDSGPDTDTCDEGYCWT